ncbi:MAG: glycosyltransferase [Actinomycetes bacterium]
MGTREDEPAAGHPVRVLWLIKGLGPGGAERLLVSLARVADPARVRYDVGYLVARKSQLVPELQAAGVRVHRLGDGSGRDPGWVRDLRRLVRAERFDVVHAHSPSVAVGARLVVRSLGHRRPRMVCTEHNSWEAYHPAVRWLNAVTYPLDDHRFAVSTQSRDSAWSAYRDSTEVLVHGVEPHSGPAASDQDVRTGLGVPVGAVLVLAVANHRPEKDYPTLIATASRLLAAHPEVVVAAVGQGPLLDHHRDLVDRASIGDRFWLLGYRPDVAELLHAADVFVLASRHEGLPVALMEAMAAGLPCVVTRVGGMPEVVRDGVDGLVVAPGNPEALAQALDALLVDPRLRARLGAAARERAGMFDIRATSRRLVEAYGSMVLPSRPRTPSASPRP